MCNLYSITTNQAAIIALFRVINRYVGNLPPMPGVFPDYPAPVVRSVGADRLLDIARVLGVSLDYLMKGEPDASVQLQVIIPQRLSEFAKRESLPFNHALALLEMRRQIVAHRSISRSEDPEDFDWERFYESVKEFLP